MAIPHVQTRDQPRWRLYRPFPREASQPWRPRPRTVLLLLATLLIAGCEAPTPTPVTPALIPPPYKTNCDTAAVTTITAAVTANGPLPHPPPPQTTPNPP